MYIPYIYIYTPASSRYVKFLPFGRFLLVKRQNFTHLEDPGKPRESLHKSQTNIKKFTETSREPKEFTKSSYSNPDRKMSSWWFQPL